MSHIDSGPLATYNSLQDKHLVGYFNNTRMKRHLRKSGLVTRRGEIVTENTYRLNMARKEHQKHVRDLMAQAIVHKALDMERHRQAEIKRKLEEISKIELVQRVRSQRRTGDEDITPYLSPRAPDTRPKSAHTSSRRRRVQSSSTRPSTAPSNRSSKKTNGVVYLDDDGFPIHRESPKSSQADREEIDSHNLRELDPHILDRIASGLKGEDQHHSFSPYSVDQTQDAQPRPPPRAPGSSRRSTARGKSFRQSTGVRRKVRGAELKTNKRSLALHRKEPAYPHATQLQSMCDVTVRYRGSNLKLSYEREDKRDEIQVYQQHCGGENLLVFHGLVEPGTDIVFTSRRHRGYPFAATFYINRVEDLRLSTCCEYKYGPRCLLGGRKGHFMFIRADGATPCYRCAVEAELARRERQRYRGTQTQTPDPKPEPEPELKAQDTQTSSGDVPEEGAKEIAIQADEDDYQDDFEEEDTNKNEKKQVEAAVDQYSDQFSSEPEEQEQNTTKKEKDAEEEEEEDNYKDDFFEQEPEPAAEIKSESESEEEIQEETKATDDVKEGDDKVGEKEADDKIQKNEKPKDEPEDEAKKDDVNYDSSSDSENDNIVLPASSSSSSESSADENIVLTSELSSSDSEYERRKSKGKKEKSKFSASECNENSDTQDDKPDGVSEKVEEAGDAKSVQDDNGEDFTKSRQVEETERVSLRDFTPEVERSSTPTPTRSIRRDSISSRSSISSEAKEEQEDEKNGDAEQIKDMVKNVKSSNEEIETTKIDTSKEESQQRISPDEAKGKDNNIDEQRKERISESGDSKKDVQDKLPEESFTQEIAEGDGDKADGSESTIVGDSNELMSAPIITVDKAESVASDIDEYLVDVDSKQEVQKDETEKVEKQEKLKDEKGGEDKVEKQETQQDEEGEVQAQVKQQKDKKVEDGEDEDSKHEVQKDEKEIQGEQHKILEEEKQDDKTSVKSDKEEGEVENKVVDVVSAEEAGVEQSASPVVDNKNDAASSNSSTETSKSDKEDELDENMEFDVADASGSVSSGSIVDTGRVDETYVAEQREDKNRDGSCDDKVEKKGDEERADDEDVEKNVDEEKKGYRDDNDEEKQDKKDEKKDERIEDHVDEKRDDEQDDERENDIGDVDDKEDKKGEQGDGDKITEKGGEENHKVDETTKSEPEHTEELPVSQTKLDHTDDAIARSETPADNTNNNEDQAEEEDAPNDANFKTEAAAEETNNNKDQEVGDTSGNAESGLEAALQDHTNNVEQEMVDKSVEDVQQEDQEIAKDDEVDVLETKGDSTDIRDDDDGDAKGKEKEDHSDVSSVSSLSSESDSDGEQAHRIKILNMQGRKLDSKKARKFARSLLKPKYYDVGTLLLNDNPIGDVGTTAVVKSMRERAKQMEDEEEEEEITSQLKLAYLNLSNCKIGNKGVIELSELLKLQSVRIEKLELSSNQIGSLGCKALAAAIRENSTMKTLNIADATLGPDGSKTIIEALADNTTLEELNIEGNDMGEEGGDALSDLVKDNSVIQRIKFERGNYVSEKTTKEIKEILDTGSFLLKEDKA